MNRAATITCEIQDLNDLIYDSGCRRDKFFVILNVVKKLIIEILWSPPVSLRMTKKHKA